MESSTSQLNPSDRIPRLCKGMKTAFILVLCLCTTFLNVESQTEAPSSMSCDMDGKITFTGVPNGINSVASDCGHATLNKTSHTIVITDCDVGTAVTLNMYKRTIPIQPALHKFIINGFTAVNLTCTKMTDGIEYTVMAHFEGSFTPTSLTSEEKESLAMSLNEHNKHTAPSTVALGQTCDLVVSGGGKHFLKIKTCQAAGTNDQTNAVSVYNSASGSNAIGLDTRSDGGEANGSLTATFKGFRLVTSSVVFLQCDIYVCLSSNCPPAGTKRKRTKPKLKTASVRFEVMSKRSAQAGNGARDMNFAGKNMMTLVLVVVASYLLL